MNSYLDSNKKLGLVNKVVLIVIIGLQGCLFAGIWTGEGKFEFADVSGPAIICCCILLLIFRKKMITLLFSGAFALLFIVNLSYMMTSLGRGRTPGQFMIISIVSYIVITIAFAFFAFSRLKVSFVLALISLILSIIELCLRLAPALYSPLMRNALLSGDFIGGILFIVAYALPAVIPVISYIDEQKEMKPL